MELIFITNAVVNLKYCPHFILSYKLSGIQIYNMSYARAPEPQLLSIEAIIQKSEFKSKILNNIPTDLKRLFLESASRGPGLKQGKKGSGMFEGLYSHTIEYSQSNYRARRNVPPPLQCRPMKSQSLNSSTANPKTLPKSDDNNIQRNVHTTRTTSCSREGDRRKTAQRRSMADEAVHIERLSENLPTNQNLNCNAPLPRQSDGETGKGETQGKVKINRFQYELVLPQREKKERGLRKVVAKEEKSDNSRNKTQETDKEQGLERKMSEEGLHQHGEQQSANPLINRKKAESLPIPEFVLAALEGEQKRISPSKIPSAQFFQMKIIAANEPRHRILKPPTAIVNMKKKISYNRIRRSEESGEEAIEPKVNLMRLVEKDSSGVLVRKNSQVLSRDRKFRSKERIPNFRRSKQGGKVGGEEEVKGWDVVEMPQFYDQY